MKATILSLKETGHVIATYTNNSGDEIDSRDFARRFVNGVPLRLVGQTSLIPVDSAADTKSPLKSASTELTIELSSQRHLLPGMLLRIGDENGENTVRVKVKKISSVDDQDLQRELEIERITPKGVLSADVAVNTPVYILNGSLSPRSVSFGLPARVMQAALVETEQQEFLSRPLEQSIVDGEPIETPAAPSAVKKLSIKVTNTGVHVTLTPKVIDSGSGARSTLVFATPVVCVMRTQKESASVVSSTVLPSQENPGDESTVRIPFAVIPEGKNSFLFFLKGFQPIWDQFDAAVPEERSRTWMSA